MKTSNTGSRLYIMGLLIYGFYSMAPLRAIGQENHCDSAELFNQRQGLERTISQIAGCRTRMRAMEENREQEAQNSGGADRYATRLQQLRNECSGLVRNERALRQQLLAVERQIAECQPAETQRATASTSDPITHPSTSEATARQPSRSTTRRRIVTRPDSGAANPAPGTSAAD